MAGWMYMSGSVPVQANALQAEAKVVYICSREARAFRNRGLRKRAKTASDVFIITRAKLVAADEDDLYDLYDVRVNGTVPSLPPTCTGTGCQGIPGAPPIFATPSSATFEGVGNFPPSQESKVKPKPKKKAKPKKKKSKHKKKQSKAKRSAHKAAGRGRSSKGARHE